MNKQQIEKFKLSLLKTRQLIAGDITTLEKKTLNRSAKEISGDLSGYSLHIADTADEDYNRSFSLDLVANKEELLNDIDAALDRIAEGTYGQCEMCGGRIPLKRLKANPQAQYCLKCKEKLEAENRP